jgi:hypothetical protein
MRLLLSKLKKRLNKKLIGLFFSDQPSLNTGSVLEGIKKLPGLIVYMFGMMYQGLDVLWMDDHLIFRQQNSMLFSITPANAIENRSPSSQPGAEATWRSNLNIITNKMPKTT